MFKAMELLYLIKSQRARGWLLKMTGKTLVLLKKERLGDRLEASVNTWHCHLLRFQTWGP